MAKQKGNSFTFVKTIDRLERVKSSANGNPRYRIHFTDGTTAYTQVDGQIGYEIDNSEYRQGPVKFTATPSGHVWNAEPVESAPDQP